MVCFHFSSLPPAAALLTGTASLHSYEVTCQKRATESVKIPVKATVLQGPDANTDEQQAMPPPGCKGLRVFSLPHCPPSQVAPKCSCPHQLWGGRHRVPKLHWEEAQEMVRAGLTQHQCTLGHTANGPQQVYHCSATHPHHPPGGLTTGFCRTPVPTLCYLTTHPFSGKKSDNCSGMTHTVMLICAGRSISPWDSPAGQPAWACWHHKIP